MPSQLFILTLRTCPMILLLTIPNASFLKCEEIRLILPVSFIYSAHFHSMGRVYTSQQKGKGTIKHSHLWTLQALVMTDLPRCASWCNNDNNISGITNHILIWSVQLCKIKLKLGTFGGEKHINVLVTGPREEPSSIILLNGHVDYLSLYPQINSSFNPHPSSFFWQ